MVIINLLAYFIIYSFMGWVIESAYRSYIEKKLINSGFVYGPFCPIYGIGAIIMFLFLNNFKDNVFILFALGFVVLSMWEYFVGWALEMFFHTKYWDYSENKFNINGRVCLVNSIFWGILGVTFIKVIHPIITGYIDKMPKDIMIFGTVGLTLYLFIDAIVTTVRIKNIDISISRITELNEIIKVKLNELKDTTQDATSGRIEVLQSKIEELKMQQAKLKNRVLKQTKRLKDAFPTMKSEKITEFLSQKIDEIRRNK